jgi:hypothetical protein
MEFRERTRHAADWRADVTRPPRPRIRIPGRRARMSGVERGNAPHAHRRQLIVRDVYIPSRAPPAPLRRVRAWLVWGELPPASGEAPPGDSRPSQPAGTLAQRAVDLRSRPGTRRRMGVRGESPTDGGTLVRARCRRAAGTELPPRRRVTDRLAIRGYRPACASLHRITSLGDTRRRTLPIPVVSVSFGSELVHQKTDDRQFPHTRSTRRFHFSSAGSLRDR